MPLKAKVFKIYSEEEKKELYNLGLNAGLDERVLAEREIEISPLISYYGENLSSASLEEILKDTNQEIL